MIRSIRSLNVTSCALMLTLMYSIYPRANLVTKSYGGCAMRVVFSNLQNCADFSDGDFRDGSSAFQHMGPETAKAREPYVTLICISIRYSYKLVKRLSVCACGCVFGCYVMAQIVTAAHRDRLAILHAPTYQ